MCYKWYKMDTTVRNLDPQAYRALRARAVLEGVLAVEIVPLYRQHASTMLDYVDDPED